MEFESYTQRRARRQTEIRELIKDPDALALLLMDLEERLNDLEKDTVKRWD